VASKTIYDSLFDSPEFANRYYQEHTRMARKLGLKYFRKLIKHGFIKGKILDVGYGFGGTLLVLARNFPESEFIGVDLSKPLLEIARKTSSELELADRSEFLKQDVHELQFEDNSIDVILNLNMVHLVNDPVQMLNEIERVLKLEGQFFIKDIRYSWLRFFEKGIKFSFSNEEAMNIINKSDLSIGRFSSDFLWWNYEKISNPDSMNK